MCKRLAKALIRLRVWLWWSHIPHCWKFDRWLTYSRGTKEEKMLTLAPERYTAGFCMVAKVILSCIWNHCIADSIDLHNARAVNFLRKPSKNMSKYYFSKCYIFLSKKFRIEKYWVYIIIQHRRRLQKQWWSSKNTAYWFLKHVD